MSVTREIERVEKELAVLRARLHRRKPRWEKEADAMVGVSRPTKAPRKLLRSGERARIIKAAKRLGVHHLPKVRKPSQEQRQAMRGLKEWQARKNEEHALEFMRAGFLNDFTRRIVWARRERERTRLTAKVKNAEMLAAGADVSDDHYDGCFD